MHQIRRYKKEDARKGVNEKNHNILEKIKIRRENNNEETI